MCPRWGMYRHALPWQQRIFPQVLKVPVPTASSQQARLTDRSVHGGFLK